MPGGVNPADVPGTVQIPVWLLVACIVGLFFTIIGGAKFVVTREASWQAWIRQLYEARVADAQQQIAARDTLNRETTALLAANTSAMIRLASVVSTLLRQERGRRGAAPEMTTSEMELQDGGG